MGEDPYRVALAGFLDTCYLKPASRQTTIDAEPPLTGVAVTDAYLGPSVNIWRPDGAFRAIWSADPRRTPQAPVCAGGTEARKAVLLAQSPLAFDSG